MSESFSTWAEAEAVLSEGMPIVYIKSAGEPTMLIVKHYGAYGCCADYDVEVHSTLRGAYTSLAHRGYDANMPNQWRKCEDGDSMGLAGMMKADYMPDPVNTEKARGVIQMLKDAIGKHPELASYTVSHPVLPCTSEIPIDIVWKHGRINITVCSDDADTGWHHITDGTIPHDDNWGYASAYPSMQALVDYLAEYLLKKHRQYCEDDE